MKYPVSCFGIQGKPYKTCRHCKKVQNQIVVLILISLIKRLLSWIMFYKIRYIVFFNYRHVGNKEHRCDTCLVLFYTYSDLQRHRRVHTLEKPFTCPTCSQRFTQSTSVNKHMQTVHGIDFKWGDVKWKQSMLYENYLFYLFMQNWLVVVLFFSN